MRELYHGGPLGHSASVLIALAEKGLDYESRRLDLAAFEQHSEAFLAVNPAGQVPVLREEGRVLTEAFFILLYLDERYPEPALGGGDPRARYAIQKWGKYVETHIAPNLAILAWAGQGGRLNNDASRNLERLPPERRALWRKAESGFGADELAAARAALAKAVDRLAEDLAEGPWLAGGAYSLADLAVYPHVARCADVGVQAPPRVEDWLARVSRRPAVRETLADGRELDRPTMGPERGRWG